MKVIKNIYNSVGLISEWSGRIIRWVIVVMILSVTYDVFMRYVFRSPTIWSFDITSMLLAVLASLAFAYVCYHNGNVRVDILYIRFSPRGKLIIDIVFTLIIFFPLYFMLAFILINDTITAYHLKETSIYTVFHPIVWPYKSLVALGFCLLCLQGVATFLKNVVTLLKGGKEPW